VNLTWKTIHYETGGNFTWPNKDGVYVIAKKINGKMKAQYVGQGDLNERMGLHESKNEPNTCLKKVMGNRDDLKTYYAILPNQTDRENSEFTLVNAYGGLDNLCNEVMPVGNLDYNIKGPFIQEIDLP